MTDTNTARLPRKAHGQFTRNADETADARFAHDLIFGLSLRQKQLPSNYFYDSQGSQLFEQITRLPEYYPTRTEIAILEKNAQDIVRHVAPKAMMVEFGSGSSRKTEILLDAIPELAAYVPIDVSLDALEDARARLARRFPSLPVKPLQGDFTTLTSLPGLVDEPPRIGFFPGSTIGNFAPEQATALLARFGWILGRESRLIIGVDLVKDRDVLLRAYDDAAGVTAAFNLNLLAHANRRFGDIFDLNAFTHRATYNERESRIEMYLVSKTAQEITLFGHTIRFGEGETLRTELSHKYTLEHFAQLAANAGWHRERVWLDDEKRFSVQALRQIA